MRFLLNTIVLCLLIGTALFIGSTYYYLSPLYTSVVKATAVMRPTAGNKAQGIVHFTQQKNGVLVQVTMKQLPQGSHGIHIHEFGDCGCPDAKCAGDHFNPTNRSHGAPGMPDTHVGDMGNIISNDKQEAVYEYIDTKMSLNGPHSIIGRTVVIHEKADDFTTQPTGDSGDRISCGVVGIMDAKK